MDSRVALLVAVALLVFGCVSQQEIPGVVVATASPTPTLLPSNGSLSPTISAADIRELANGADEMLIDGNSKVADARGFLAGLDSSKTCAQVESYENAIASYERALVEFKRAEYRLTFLAGQGNPEAGGALNETRAKYSGARAAIEVIKRQIEAC